MANATTLATAREQQLANASLQFGRSAAALSGVIEQVLGTASNNDVQVLSHLHTHPAQRPRDLMELTGLSRPSVANLVARLEELRLVERSFGEHDRRTTLTSLSRLGRRRMIELSGVLDEHFVHTRPQAEEILELLGRDGCDCPGTRGVDDSSIAIVGRMGEVGGELVARSAGAEIALRPRQWDAICALMMLGRSRPGALAELLDLSSGGLTYLMDQLEAEDLVVRRHDHPDDRRGVVIQLSENGVRVGQVICAAVEAVRLDLCRVLSMTLLDH